MSTDRFLILLAAALGVLLALTLHHEGVFDLLILLLFPHPASGLEVSLSAN